ncbi:PREDICTED: uncharacterized protein LOC107168542 isoform X2 [Diuraphis noxia]|uniref:uncharacterized protein LOC107168542 isoform X2 n=1 Tax=Diuraphis noxia TaxID=143948 RepID=UPI00076384C7|nr:PREDICTED: uncharacterized protein LOC107168542 isoform X2 [Diuraphis noxia]
MSEEQPNQQHNYQNFSDRKKLKDLPFYRRYPRTFAITGSTIGFLILFSKGFYDIFKPNTAEDIKRKLVIEKIKQLNLQKEIESRAVKSK